MRQLILLWVALGDHPDAGGLQAVKWRVQEGTQDATQFASISQIIRKYPWVRVYRAYTSFEFE